jgi:microcystin-dependent protein
VSTPYLGEIKIVSWNFAAKGWAFCNGQLLPVAQNTALASLLSNRFGGDGVNTFGLPNLQGRVPIHAGGGYNLAQSGGEVTHTLSLSEVASHVHTVMGTNTPGDSPIPAGNYLGEALNMYTAPAGLGAMQQATVSSVGTGGAHNNMQPYLVLNFVIALQGVLPTQS